MKNLYKKIHEIMSELESLEKDMAVGSGNYQYKGISETIVLNTVKPKLKEKNVIIVPVDTEVEEHEIVYKSGKYDKNRFMTQIKVTWLIADVDSGESLRLSSVGNGADTGDKGSGKAMTYAYKSMLQKTFMMFSGEDADNTHSDDLPGNKTCDKNSNKEKDDNFVKTQELIDIAKQKGYDETSILKTYAKKSKKSTSEVKFIPQEWKQELYDGYSRLENKGDKK